MADADPFPSNGAPGDDPRPERAKRDSLLLMTTIARETGEQLGQIKVRNVSATGLMADCAYMLAPDDRVVIPLRGVGQVAGRVAWARENRIGVSFDRPIDPQLTRQPVNVGPADNLPIYLRHHTRAQFFK